MQRDKYLPGSCKKTCNLVSKACIVGVFHDGHQLNTVITCTQEDREQKYGLNHVKSCHICHALVSIGPLAILSLLPALAV